VRVAIVDLGRRRWTLLRGERRRKGASSVGPGGLGAGVDVGSNACDREGDAEAARVSNPLSGPDAAYQTKAQAGAQRLDAQRPAPVMMVPKHNLKTVI